MTRAHWQQFPGHHHDMAYWRRRANREGGPLYLLVLRWDGSGQQIEPLEYEATQLKSAKEAARKWVEEGGGSMSELRAAFHPLHGGREVEIFGSFEPAHAPNIAGGRARAEHFTAADADPEELRTGTEHELEHTSSRAEARQTALDHLAEDPHYYRHLAACEAHQHGAPMAENGSRYYVWPLTGDRPLAGEGPWGPFTLTTAKQFARISATEGAHDRAVTNGLDPQAAGFEILRRYRRGTGERVI